MYRYKNDKEIEAMTNLVSAYQKKEINEFEHILKGKALLQAAIQYDNLTNTIYHL